MKCIHCQGVMEKGASPLHIDRKSLHLTIDNVPAWVCRQCGEAYFEEHEVRTVQELTEAIEEKAQHLIPASAVIPIVEKNNDKSRISSP